MENKSNSLNRIKRQQREKVLRFSIRKYSFGAASVAVAALMFLGARVASADSVVDKTSQLNAGVVNPKGEAELPKESPESTANKVDEGHKSPENQSPAVPVNNAPTVDKAKLRKVVEELNALLSTKLNLDESVVSPIKDRLQKGKEALESSELAQKDIDELVELLSKDVTVVSAAKEVTEVQVDKQADKTEKPADNLVSQTSPEVSASEENQTVSAKKDALKVSVDQLQAAVLELPEHETSKEVLEKANELLGLAQGVLENTTVSLNDIEDMTKRVKRMFNSVKNATTRLTSGSHDPRNGKSMGQGTGGRAATVSSRWTDQDNLLSYQRFYGSDGSGNRRNNDRQFVEEKVDMTARIQTINGQRYVVYDVFFNNNGQNIAERSYQQAYRLLLQPKILDLAGSGAYNQDTIRDLYFEIYRKNNPNEGGTLSQNPEKFHRESTLNYHFLNDNERSQNGFTYFNSAGVRASGDHWKDMRDIFKANQNDPVLEKAVKLEGNHKDKSYGLGLKTNDKTAAVHMHLKAKLRPDVTDEEVRQAFTIGVASSFGLTTHQSYTFVSGKEPNENVEPTVKQSTKYPIIGKEVTKKVDEPLGNLNKPVEIGFVARKDGSTSFPNNTSWSWPNGQPSTGTAGVFQRQVKATYSDNSSNTATATLKVIPNQPTIDQSSVNEKAGKTGQEVTVNVGNGVPDGSTVNLYEGKTLIGTGKTNRGTAKVTVKGALPEKPITAETVVNNGGTVTSERSTPVKPTPERDTQKPTLEISRKSQTVVEGGEVTFTITARDNKVVTIEGKDFTDKYGDRLLSRQATNNKVKITDTEKIIEITIRTKKEDIGKPHTITFGAHDDAGNKADPVTFTFNVTPRDNQKPIVEVGGIRLTENEPQSAQFYVYRGATFNPTVKAWDNSGNITSMSVENLPNGSKAQTYTPQTGKDGSTEDKKYTTSLSTGTVVDTQTLGDHVAKFKISDGVNSATYLMKYKVVDVVVENTPKTVELNSKSGDPNEYLNTAGKQDKSGKPVVESQADVHFPGGMKFRWDNANGSDTNVTLSKVGTQTHKAIAVFPENPSRRDGAQVFAPKTAERDVVFNVVDNEKPKASLNGKELSETANEPIFTVYRGATFNPELKVSDNSGVISKVEVKGGLPKGVTPSTFTAQTGKTEATPYAERLSSGAVLDTETLGVHESTIHVEGSNPSDSRDFKFKYRVVDIETKNVDKNGIAKVPVASTLNKDNSSKNIDAHNYLKVVDSEDKADRGNNYLPSGMTWTWKDRNGVNKDRGTTLDNSGKYTRTATAIFPGTKANNMTDDTSTTRDVFAPAEIKRKVILAVTPTAPTVEGKENGSVTITPPKQPDSTNQQDIDKITLTYTPTGQTSPETVTVTKSGSKWTVNGKSDDKVSVSPEGVVTISDAEIADKTEVTAKVSKNIDGVLTLESPVARGTANGPLAAEVTNPAPVTEKAQITPVTVVTPNKPGSSITVDGPVNGLTVDDEGKLKGKPEVNDWKPKEEERTVEIPVKVTKGGETVTVKVPVPILRDTDGDGIPDKEDSDDDNDGIPDEEEIKNGTDPKTPTTQTPVEIEITPQPNGDAIVTPKKPGGGTYPPGTKVEIPGEDGNTITVEIGKDGSGKVPNDKLPKKAVPGTGTVTEPNKKPSQPVNVTTPARKTPTIELKPDPKTGDVTVTPQRPGGGTYPPGTKVEIPGEDGNTITVEIGKDGSGKVPNDKLPKKAVPGTGTVTEPNKKPSQPVNVTTPARKTPTIELKPDPKTGDVTVTPQRPGGGTYPPGTTVEIPGEDGPITVEIGKDGKGKVPNDKLPKKAVPGTGKITEPGKPAVEVPNVTTPAKVTPETPETEKPVEIEITPQPNGDAIVTPKKPGGGTYPPGTKVEIPGEDGNTITVEIGKDGSGKVPNDKLPKKAVPGTGTVTEPNKKPSQPVNVTTPARKTPTIELKPDPKTGDVTVTPQRPGGGTYPPGTTVEIPGEDGPITVEIGKDGKGKVPNDKLPKKAVPGTGKITEPGKPAVEVPNVTTPAKVTPETPETEKPVEIEITPQPNGDAIVTPKKPGGGTYPPGTKVEIPGEDGNTITVEIGKDGSGKVPNDKLPKKAVPGTGTVTEPNKKPSQPVNVTTPARKTPTIELKPDPKTGDVTVTPQRPGGGTYPPGTTVEIPGEDGPITVEIGKDGKGKVPNDKLPKKAVPGTGKITEPGKPAVEVPNVTTPAKVTPETPETEKPVEIEITPQPNGDAIVTPKKPGGGTYPPGTKVEIPGEDGNTITVEIGKDGSGKVPNDKLPKKAVPGTGTVTEPNKKPSQPVNVTTPARKTPTIELKPDPKTGDVTVTPQRPGGGTYPPGTTVEIPGEDGPITVEIGKDGKGKVPNDKLPKKAVPGTGKITEPGKPAVEVPNVTTPAKVTPETPETEKPVEIEITPQPNGDAIVTPKKPGGGTYPPGTKVEIPGEDGNTITVEIGKDGSGKVPNDKLPKKAVPGTGTVTEPNKKPSQPVNVTTPARKTPTIELKPDPKTGDVTVTPQRPGGGTYPPGTTVEIPGEDGPITVEIGKDGKGKVPNDKLPKKAVPGTGKITEPGKPAVEVPNVTTPAKVTPETPETEKPVEIEITPQPNGDAIVTPKKPGGGTYPPGTKVEIPGEDGNTITVEIGKDGSGKVPNDKLPKKAVPGTGTVTEPNKKPSQPVNVTTPARKTPTIELKPDPKTGDVTVTPQRPGGGTYPPGTTVEIPGEDGPITVEIGKDGKGKVPNDKLPKKAVPGTGKITEPGKPAVEVPNVTTPAKVTPETPETEKPVEIEITPQPNGDAIVTPKKPGGGTYPPGTKVEIPGEDGNTITVEIGKDGSGKVPNDKLPKKAVPGTGTVTEPNKKPSQPVNVTTPARKTPTIELKPDPKTGDVTVTPQRPGGGTYPPGTTVEIPGEDGPITVEIGKDGKGKVPNDKLPKKAVPGTGKITEPGKPAVEVPNVTTPAKVTPETPETEKPVEIEITPQPNGDAIVTPKKPGGGTYPPGTKVEIPGEDGNTITVEIGKDGSGKVPNDKLPKKAVPGTGTVTEPNKKPSQPVNVTTPARKTPTIELKPDPKTGDVTVTPQRPGGGTYPPGTTVEIPGEDGPITVEIGKDGKGKVPNDKLPKKAVPGTGKITEPGKPAVEVPNVTTPAKVTPETPETEKPVEIEITPQPNGDAIVTPKKPGGGTYPPGTKVEIPGEDGNTITVEIGKDGSGKVPNDKLPKKAVPGTGTVTEPNKKPSQPVNVTTPARKTPTIELKPDPKTGDVTVTPQRPGGGTYPPGTTVEIPGEDGPITVEIGKDGKGKVPNDKLPKKAVPGTGKITEPGKPAVEVPNVTTPAKVTPETPETEKPVEIEITPQPNGDAIVTPKKPGGGTYPPGTKVEIPGEDGNTITVEIGKDGKGKVPNSELPEGKVPGTAKITEPGQPAVEVPVETPAKVTPETPETEKPGKIEITQQPNGNAIVTPKKPDGSTYPPGTTVEIPGENGTPITVTIGDNGKGKVPNDNLPKTNVPGTGKVTEPNKKPSQPVDVTTPARKTPTLDVEQDPKTGEVTVTPKKPDGSTYPPGTTVEIPGENGPITVEIGQDGKGKVPNDKLPKKEVPGTGKITEPGQPAVEVPNVTTPGKFTPETPTTEKPGEIGITQQPNGNAIVTPKKPDGSTYPPRTKVEIPGENGTTITVTIGDNGSGEVPNDKLPKGNVPGKGTVTEPNKKPSQPVDVTTPARKTPTVDVEQDPKTGDVTVTPKKPDGSTYPPGTKVEIPGKDGNPITVIIGEDGKGKVPNSELPEGKVPGTAKITEPDKPTVEVPDVTTPGKVTPSTPTDTNPVAPVTPDMPVKPDTNGGSGQDTPAPATPNADQVDTKTTVDNGAKSNDSQNVLPNTGTESNAALASLGLLGLLSGFGLVARKKKED